MPERCFVRTSFATCVVVSLVYADRGVRGGVCGRREDGVKWLALHGEFFGELLCYDERGQERGIAQNVKGRFTLICVRG